MSTINVHCAYCTSRFGANVEVRVASFSGLGDMCRFVDSSNAACPCSLRLSSYINAVSKQW